LEDALRGILDAGGNINEDWTIEKAFEIGDKAAGVDVLQKMYTDWKDAPMHVDLDVMWKNLGIEANGGTVVLKDDAPMSAVRRAVEMGTPSAKGGDKGSPAGAGAAKNDSAAAVRPLAVFAGRTARSN
jgi:hypothetical protein